MARRAARIGIAQPLRSRAVTSAVAGRAGRVGSSLPTLHRRYTDATPTLASGPQTYSHRGFDATDAADAVWRILSNKATCSRRGGLTTIPH